MTFQLKAQHQPPPKSRFVPSKETGREAERWTQEAVNLFFTCAWRNDASLQASTENMNNRWRSLSKSTYHTWEVPGCNVLHITVKAGDDIWAVFSGCPLKTDLISSSFSHLLSGLHEAVIKQYHTSSWKQCNLQASRRREREPLETIRKPNLLKALLKTTLTRAGTFLAQMDA